MSLPDPLGMYLRSGIRGRQRWEVKALYDRPEAALELEKALRQHAGILHVRANPVTSRVLVIYSPEIQAPHIEPLIRNSLREILFRQGLRTPDGGHASALSRILKTSLPARSQLSRAPLLSVIGHSFHLLQGLSFVSIVNTARGEGPGFLGAFGLISRGARLAGFPGMSLLLPRFELFV